MEQVPGTCGPCALPSGRYSLGCPRPAELRRGQLCARARQSQGGVVPSAPQAQRRAPLLQALDRAARMLCSVGSLWAASLLEQPLGGEGCVNGPEPPLASLLAHGGPSGKSSSCVGHLEVSASATRPATGSPTGYKAICSNQIRQFIESHHVVCHKNNLRNLRNTTTCKFRNANKYKKYNKYKKSIEIFVFFLI